MNFDLNLDLLDLLRKDYWDWKWPLFLRYSFPINFEGDHNALSNDRFTHPSALQHSSHVLQYLLEERTHNAIFGLLTAKPFGDVTHISPFITRAKTSSDKRRVIVYLS